MFRSRDERGAVLPMTAILATVLITFSAFAIDIGMQRVARSDMQALADVVALDLAREMGGRTKSAIEADLGWTAAKNRSIERNAGTVGDAPAVTAELGLFDADHPVFTPINGADIPNAVRVTTSTSVNYALAPGSGGANRSAIATIEQRACFSVGSSAASVSTSESALGPLLDGLADVDADLLSPEGIADLKSASVPLAGLAADLGVGGTDALLSKNVTVGELFSLTAEALERQGKYAAVDALGQLALQLDGFSLTVGDILNIAPGDDSALDLGLNALDLLTTAAQVAAKDAGVGLDLGTPNLPGVGALGVTATIVENAKMACGRVGEAVASSAQVRVTLAGSVAPSVVTGLVNSLLGLVVSLDLSLGLDVSLAVAPAQGTLREINCSVGPDGSTGAISVETVTGLVETGIEMPLNITARLLLGLIPITVRPTVDVAVAPLTGKTSTLALPPFEPLPSTALPSRETAHGAPNIGPVTVSVSGLGALGLLLNPLVGGLTGIVSSVTAGLTTVLDPVLKTLGIRLGNATVTATSRPTCNSPSLRGGSAD